MTKLTFILILTFIVHFANGQSMTFLQLDGAISSNAQEILTNKIKFLNNDKLNLKESKLTLDSIAWYLVRHPKTIISITLLKAKTSTDSAASKIGQVQSKQIVDYLSKKGINSKRIVSLVNYTEHNSDNNSINTRVRVLSNDFSDLGTK